MAHLDPNQPHGTTNVFYWAVWAFMFVASKAAGFVGKIQSAISTEIEIPKHDIHYLPQLHELIPAMILAAACAVISFLVSKGAAYLWTKIFPSKK
ncbi:MAG TPA: hypothetical protein VD905_06280 [Flavobacteriales bacterium]|nr:hypothetical protein [Flavobacteriales bacterium]